MREYSFTLVLNQEPNLDEADRLYGIFNDGSICTSAGVPKVHFDREGPSLLHAIDTAAAEIKQGGFETIRVEFELDQIERPLVVASP